MMNPIESHRWPARRFAQALGVAVPLALALGAMACGDGDNQDGPADAASDADVHPPPVSVLLAERVFSTDGSRLYYLSVLPDVPTAAVDRSKALELPSADVELFNDRVYVRNRMNNKMTRYRVTDQLTLEKDGEFSFAGVALADARYNSVYVSPDRAYVLDAGSWRMIGWNPSKMELTGEILTVPSAAKQGITGVISAAVKAGNRLIASVYWENLNPLVMYPSSGALVIDPATPAVPVFVEDPRVGGAYRVTADGNGDAYMIGVVGGDVHKFGKTPDGGTAFPTSGLVRLPAGQNTFDAGYLVDVEAITGSPGVAAIHRIDSNTLLAQVYDPALALPDTVEAYRSSANFIYVLINTVDKTFTPVAALPRGRTGNSGNHVVDGKLYIQVSNATGSVAYAASSAGVTQAFPIPAGDVWHLQRIR